MGQEDLNIGIIGAGRIAHVHARSIQAIASARLAGVVDVEAHRAEQFAKSYDIRSYESFGALLEDRTVNAVVICTPTFVHAEQAIQAAVAGKHILCEKPIAMTLAESDRIVSTARQAGVTLMVGHVLRFMPEYRQVYEWLAGGELGLVRTVYMSRMSGAAAGAWQGWILDHKFGALDAQIHDLDFLAWTLGEGQSVTGRGWRGPAGNWAHIDTVLVYDDERWAVVESSFGVPPTYPFTMYVRVIGERGAVEYHFQGESYARPTARRLTLYPMQGKAQDRTPPPVDPYADQMHHFVTNVRRGEPPSCGRPEDARTALELALAVQRSLDSGGQEVTLPTA